jgi:orotate phosphoribosyltransferase
MNEKLKESLKACQALQFGDFTLASGKRSKYYIDIKRASTDPMILADIAKDMEAEMNRNGIEPDAIAGVVLGSVPLAVALSLRTGIPYVMVRKEKKDHGTGKLIEGVLASGMKVLVVEDVVTSAGSSAEAIAILRDAGAKVEYIIAVIDRQEGGAARLSGMGIQLLPLLTAEEVLRE